MGLRHCGLVHSGLGCGVAPMERIRGKNEEGERMVRLVVFDRKGRPEKESREVRDSGFQLASSQGRRRMAASGGLRTNSLEKTKGGSTWRCGDGEKEGDEEREG
ncbi:hypothetical protein HAX54_044449 [Datura stramonium]|uniref:Uncharacterized protein n=1 Tax=Datura stramonium TaxID=4076 RepID=A0ABS8WGB7_DATST|nr:hypothetical protein [Datura stramonium]